MVWETYKEKVGRLSQRIVEIQKPIRVLEAIKWDQSIEEQLRKYRFKQLPKVTTEYYSKISIGFDPEKKMQEFEELSQDILLTLGVEDSIGKLLKTIVEEYQNVVQMLLFRGTKKFWEYSKKLYGSPKDMFFDEQNTICDLGQLLYSIFSRISDDDLGVDYPKSYSAPEVVSILNERFKNYFSDQSVEAKLSDGILADASAGGDTVKVKEGVSFSSRDIDILEVHEGWVHVATTQNGHAQHVAKWLSKGPPRCSATQEGLAVILEIFTFRSHPKRARRINDRILAIDKVEDGANLLELIEFYRIEGYSEEDAVASAVRIFRGGVVEGGAPFTKDVAYCRGFIENYNFMRAAIRAGKPHLIPFFFSGKLHVNDIPLLYQKYKEGLVDFPKYLPPQFKDLNGIAVWMGFSSFLNMINLKTIQSYYDKLFKSYL